MSIRRTHAKVLLFRYSGVFLCLVMACVNTQSQSVVSAQEQGDYGARIDGDDLISILEMIARQIKANYESIETWSGKCEFRDSKYFITANPALSGNHGSADRWTESRLTEESVAQARETIPEGDGYWYLKDGTGEFLVDQRNLQYRMIKAVSSNDDVWDMSTAVQFRNIVAPFKQIMLLSSDRAVRFSPDKMFSIKPNSDSDQEFPKARAVFVSSVLSVISSTELVDVRDAFTIGGPSLNEEMAYWRRPEMIVAALKKQKSEADYEAAKKHTQLFVSSGEVPVYTLVFGDVSKSHSICQFDGGVGLNAISFVQAKGQQNVSSRKTSYVERSGIFLPNEVRYNWISYSKKDGSVTGAFARTIRIDTDWINRPISEEEFDLQSLGLKYGDRKFDEITGEDSVYDDRTGFVSAEEFQMDESRYSLAQSGPKKDQLTKASRPGDRILVVVNGIVIVGVLGYLLFRRYRKRT